MKIMELFKTRNSLNKQWMDAATTAYVWMQRTFSIGSDVRYLHELWTVIDINPPKTYKCFDNEESNIVLARINSIDGKVQSVSIPFRGTSAIEKLPTE